MIPTLCSSTVLSNTNVFSWTTPIQKLHQNSSSPPSLDTFPDEISNLSFDPPLSGWWPQLICSSTHSEHSPIEMPSHRPCSLCIVNWSWISIFWTMIAPHFFWCVYEIPISLGRQKQFALGYFGHSVEPTYRRSRDWLKSFNQFIHNTTRSPCHGPSDPWICHLTALWPDRSNTTL